MRDIIKKILKENINPQIDVGDIFITSGTKEKDLIRITDIRCGGTIRDKEFNTPDWGKQVIEYDGCDLMYQVSTDQGITWEYESEDGHWVEVAWIKNIIEKGWWELLHKNMDFFDILNESKEEDNLEWARDTIKQSVKSDVKWIRVKGGKRYKSLVDRHIRYQWQYFNEGVDDWFFVTGMDTVNNELCFITTLYKSETEMSNYYATPIKDYKENEISFDKTRPISSKHKY